MINFIFNKRNIIKRNYGVTLISLVITIIILLILAGISISVISGNNSILNQATSAKEKTDESEEIEGIKLATMSANINENGYQPLNQENLQNAIDTQFGIGKVSIVDNGDGTFTVRFKDSKKEYNITSNGIENGIDWIEAMKEAQAPEEQITQPKNIIGIGTDGKPVNMDLWKFLLLEDGTYILNESETSTTTGYNGSFTADGKIIGYIPEFISVDNGANYKEVSNLRSLFKECNDLKTAPAIPKTATNIMNLFHSCSNLETAPSIPSGVIIMQGTFYNCSSIENAPYIPNTVTNMQGTFQGCGLLKSVINISNNATNMRATFNGCILIENIPDLPESVEDIYMCFRDSQKLKKVSKIPSRVTNIQNSFVRCYELSGILIIDANLTEANIKYCFMNASHNDTLTLKCNNEIYDLFYDENRTNKINSNVCEYDSNIILERK